VPALGLSSYWRLIDHFQSPTAVLGAKKQELLRVKGIRELQVAGLFSLAEVMARGQRSAAVPFLMRIPSIRPCSNSWPILRRSSMSLATKNCWIDRRLP
jgi:hypothetical protein